MPTWLIVPAACSNYRVPVVHGTPIPAAAKRAFSVGGNQLTWALLYLCGMKHAAVDVANQQ